MKTAILPLLIAIAAPASLAGAAVEPLALLPFKE